MFGSDTTQVMHLFAWGTITSVMYFPALLLVLHAEPGWITRALSWPIYRQLATLGYGVYLVHIPLIDHVALPIVHALDDTVSLWILWPAALLGVLLGSFAIGYVMHVLIEKPSLALRQRLAA
jgi:peptidoglycan/LPS O-acetylase OafA/YrhL